MRIPFESTNSTVIYDRRPNRIPLAVATAERCPVEGARLTYRSRSGLSGHWDVRLPYGVEVCDAYRVETHHVMGLHRPESGERIVMPPPCHLLPAIRLSPGRDPEFAWLPWVGRDEWRPPSNQLFEGEFVDVE